MFRVLTGSNNDELLKLIVFFFCFFFLSFQVEMEEMDILANQEDQASVMGSQVKTILQAQDDFGNSNAYYPSLINLFHLR